MKNKHILLQTTVLLSLSLACAFSSAYGQDGTKKKPGHSEKRLVEKNNGDSTVTILIDDEDNGQSVKRTIVIHNGDTTTNMIVSENSNGKNKKGTSVIIDGDSIVKIDELPDLPDLTEVPDLPGIKKYNINKFKVIIVNGDSIMVKPNGENIKITVDTAFIRQKMTANKAFKDADKKRIIMSDKYIILNTNKFTHKDSTHSKWHSGVLKVGLEGFDLGFTQFMENGNFGVSQENKLLDLTASKSVNVNFRVVDLKVNLASHKLYLDAGVEFDLHDYGFSNNTTILPNAPKFQAVTDSVNFSRDKLSTQYLELPLMLCFNSNPRHQSQSFSIGIGAYGGMMLGAYSKQVSDSRGLQRYFSNYDFNPVDYGVMGQIGYGKVQIFAKYNMSPIFQTASGAPNLQSITFGIKLFHPFGWS